MSKAKVIDTEKEPLFIFSKDALKRPGVILRLVSILIAIVAVILTIALPTVIVAYANYSQSSEFPIARADIWNPELINGATALFGGDHFFYYVKMKDGPVVLKTVLANTNWTLIILLLIAIINMALVVMVTFSKKMEKLAKLVTLIFFLAGVAVLASPVWFMVSNNFGNTYAISTNDVGHYVQYDSLYVHSAYGAIVGFAVFAASAIVFSIGTALEMGKGDNRNVGED